ncbi:MAG: tetratricopeptide repeat protein, partial [bacterium]
MASSKFPSRPEAGYSFVGSTIRLEGFLRFSGNLLIDGRFRGDIEGDGLLELGTKAHTEGKIAADELIHRGHSEGDLVAVKRLELLPGCLHRGDVQAKRVKISPHASLEGSLKMPDASPDIPPNPVAKRRRIKVTMGVVFLLFVGTAFSRISLKPPPFLKTFKSRLDRFLDKSLDPFRLMRPYEIVEKESDIRQKEIIEEASRLERNGKSLDAVKRLTEAIEIGARHTVLAQFRLAKNFARSGRSEDAIKQLRSLLKNVPGHMEGRILMGDIYAASGNFQKAAIAYAQAARRDPADIVLKRRLREIRARLETKRSSQVAKMTSPSAEDLLRKAERMLGEKKTVQATKILREGIAQLPNNARLHFQLGTTLAEIAERTAAIKAYRKVIELAPDWLDAYVRLGALLEAGRRDKEAIALYRRAAALDPSNIEMLVRISRLLKRRGRRDEAHRMLLKLQDKYPQSVEVLVELGDLLWEDGKSEPAKKVFQRVLGLSPDSAPALNRMAWFHVVEMKNLERGIELSKKSLDISPDTPPYLDT